MIRTRLAQAAAVATFAAGAVVLLSGASAPARITRVSVATTASSPVSGFSDAPGNLTWG